MTANFIVNAPRIVRYSTRCLNDVQGISDSIQAAIQKYTNHSSSLKISETVDKMKFSFNEIVNSDIEAEIKNLNSRKAKTFKKIPAKLLKDNRDVCNEPLLNIKINGIKDSMFADGLNSADITPVHKKGDKTDKRNYRPVSMLPVVSKFFERIIQKQIGIYMEKTLSPYLCRYLKGFNAQHALSSYRKMAHYA